MWGADRKGRQPAKNGRKMKILTGNSNRPLAEAISAYLNLPLVNASVRRFSDMEVFVEINENIRGEDVFIIQPTSFPTNDNLMELLVSIDALKRSSARRITAVIPYYGYARQDRKSGPRTPISAKLVANLITTAGADRVLTVDLQMRDAGDVIPPGTLSGDITQRGLELGAQHRLSPRLALDMGVRLGKVKGLTDNAWSDDLSTRVGALYALSPNSSLQISLRHQQFDSNVLVPVNETSLSASLTQRF